MIKLMRIERRDWVRARKIARRVAWGLVVLLIGLTTTADLVRTEPGTHGGGAGCPLHANPAFTASPNMVVIVAVAWTIVLFDFPGLPNHPGPAIFVPPRG